MVVSRGVQNNAPASSSVRPLRASRLPDFPAQDSGVQAGGVAPGGGEAAVSERATCPQRGASLPWAGLEQLGLRFRAYPDPAQLVLLARHAGACRVVWNIALEQRLAAL